MEHKYIDADALEQMLDNMIARYGGNGDTFTITAKDSFKQFKCRCYRFFAEDAFVEIIAYILK